MLDKQNFDNLVDYVHAYNDTIAGFLQEENFDKKLTFIKFLTVKLFTETSYVHT